MIDYLTVFAVPRSTPSSIIFHSAYFTQVRTVRSSDDAMVKISFLEEGGVMLRVKNCARVRNNSLGVS